MAKKEVKIEDVKSEDIAKEIEKSFYHIENTKGKAISKLSTFILLFFIYIWLSSRIQDPLWKLIVIVFGLAILVFLFQETVFPAFRASKKESVLEP